MLAVCCRLREMSNADRVMHPRYLDHCRPSRIDGAGKSWPSISRSSFGYALAVSGNQQTAFAKRGAETLKVAPGLPARCHKHPDTASRFSTRGRDHDWYGEALLAQFHRR